MRGSLLLVSLAGSLLPMPSVAPAIPQDPSCLYRTLPVYFRDSQNLPVRDVQVTDLEARIHGKPARIISLEPDPRPHRIVLILDASGSMFRTAGEPALWGLELLLAQHFLKANGEKAPIALLTFNDRINNIAGFSPGNSAATRMLQQIANDRDYAKNPTKKHTALRDAVLQAIQLLDHPTSADAVYVLTDGGDNASHHTLEDLHRYVYTTSVRVFAVLLVSHGYRGHTPEEITGPEQLAEIVQGSGGEVLTTAQWQFNSVALSADPNGTLKVGEALSRLYEAICQDSLMEIQLPFAVEKNERFELKFSKAQAAHRKGIQLTYPTTLVSCAAEVSADGRPYGCRPRAPD